jgi:pyridoxine kinase
MSGARRAAAQAAGGDLRRHGADERRHHRHSSHVARGAVGNRGMAFALERLGYNVWAVPTVVLPHHPGHGPAERIVPEDAAFCRLLETLADDRLAEVGAIISGYLAAAAQAEPIAALVRRLKCVRPEALYVCDPVIGDAGGLYVAPEIAGAVRDRLMPLADVATPNAFECAWLSGGEVGDLAALADSARALGTRTVAVTSAPALMRGNVANLLVGGAQTFVAEHRLVASDVKGTGDVMAALLTARLLEGREPARALEMATASLVELVAASARLGRDELALAEAQQAIVQPRALVNMRRLAPPRS